MRIIETLVIANAVVAIILVLAAASACRSAATEARSAAKAARVAASEAGRMIPAWAMQRGDPTPRPDHYVGGFLPTSRRPPIIGKGDDPFPKDTWLAVGGPLDGQEITTVVGNEFYSHNVEDPARQPGYRYVCHTYRRAKLIEPSFIWMYQGYEGIAGESLAWC